MQIIHSRSYAGGSQEPKTPKLVSSALDSVADRWRSRADAVWQEVKDPMTAYQIRGMERNPLSEANLLTPFPFQGSWKPPYFILLTSLCSIS